VKYLLRCFDNLLFDLLVFLLNFLENFFFLCLVGLGFEFKASCLQTGTLPFEPHLSPSYSGYFGDGVL
jgi:hypothetical protein